MKTQCGLRLCFFWKDYRVSMSEETTGDSQTAKNLSWCISCSKDGIISAQGELDCDDLKGDFTSLIG